METKVSAESEPWLSVEQISIHLGVSKETIYRWIDKRRIPSYRLGKVWRFRASEVNDWLKKGEAAENLNLSANNAETPL